MGAAKFHPTYDHLMKCNCSSSKACYFPKLFTYENRDRLGANPAFQQHFTLLRYKTNLKHD